MSQQEKAQGASVNSISAVQDQTLCENREWFDHRSDLNTIDNSSEALEEKSLKYSQLHDYREKGIDKDKLVKVNDNASNETPRLSDIQVLETDSKRLQTSMENLKNLDSKARYQVASNFDASQETQSVMAVLSHHDEHDSVLGQSSSPGFLSALDLWKSLRQPAIEDNFFPEGFKYPPAQRSNSKSVRSSQGEHRMLKWGPTVVQNENNNLQEDQRSSQGIS